MDDYRGNVRRVQQALNQDAAFIRPDPYLARRVMLAEEAEGGGRRRRKLSTGLALVIVLPAAVAAAGVVVYQYYQRAIRNEAAYGAYQQWPLAEKLDFIEQLVSEGVSLDAEQLALLQDAGLSPDAQERLADAIITDHFGDGHDGSLSAVSIMEADGAFRHLIPGGQGMDERNGPGRRFRRDRIRNASAS
ncbi:MAG: hypothetical protein ACI4OY_11600 [Aristaeellaceae bacterium]